MKRRGYLYQEISKKDNLLLAFHKATRGKRGRPDVVLFRANLHENITRIQQQLLAHQIPLGRYRFFKIYDPKERMICAAAFPERVLHHAIMNICESNFEQFSIHDSYACRKGKGVHKAINRTQYFSRRYPWFLQLDIKHYFDNIDHATLLKLLGKRFKDQELLDLFAAIISSYQTKPGKGMPIGNLISQHCANLYLALFDHWVKEELRWKGYLRYMDDFLLFAPTKKVLNDALILVDRYLQNHLGLKIKENWRLGRCQQGIPFLGYRISPDIIRLTRASKRRFIVKLRRYQEAWEQGRWSENELVRHVEPLLAFIQAADTFSLRTNIVQRYGVSSE